MLERIVGISFYCNGVWCVHACLRKMRVKRGNLFCLLASENCLVVAFFRSLFDRTQPPCPLGPLPSPRAPSLKEPGTALGRSHQLHPSWVAADCGLGELGKGSGGLTRVSPLVRLVGLDVCRVLACSASLGPVICSS